MLADSFPGRHGHTLPTRRAHARLLRLALVDALLELLETRAQRASELREFVRTEQNQHDDRNYEELLSPESKRAAFYTTGMEHSPTSATGTGWERTSWRAVPSAAWEALKKAETS